MGRPTKAEVKQNRDEYGDALEGVAELLRHIEDDSELREGLEETPARVVAAMGEMTAGYHKSPEEILDTTFALDDLDPTLQYNGMVILRGIEMFSLCEHHLLPFVGEAAVAYIPNERVVGLSKLARLVDCYARRLQCQERITAQVVDAIIDHLDARGAAVVIESTHFCMKMRGVGKKDASMLTSEVRGSLKNDSDARAEALRLLQIH